ncbi:MAG: hypothetical protein OEW79_12355 [Betaproteobacteria bacterium]|jgi:hypothetical protein|nr:hypothetical protein [Betaproteobacteria bacterium]MDH5343609.1 hypothetical protein [Betaproteobacteria bacterium]
MTLSPANLVLSIVLAVLVALLTVAAFRGYLSPDFLLGFANTFSC